MGDGANAATASAAGTATIGGELAVHRLGFGAMRITGAGVWGPPADRGEAVRVLRRAVELGIQLIDTADSYGPDVSEELIAEALHPYPDGLVVATKGGFLRDGPDRWRPDGRPEHLRAAIEGSLRRLRLDRIPLHQLHTADPDVPYEESLGALVELRDEGKIAHIGLSNVSAATVRRAVELTPVASVQNRYNQANRHYDDVVDLAAELGFAFLPWAPLGGRAPTGGPLAAVAARHGATPTQVAIAWQLARSPQVVPIPGTGSVAHLEENVAAAGLRLSEHDLAELARSGRRPSVTRRVARGVTRRVKRYLS